MQLKFQQALKTSRKQQQAPVQGGVENPEEGAEGEEERKDGKE